MAAVAVVEAVAPLLGEAELGIHWPNDVFLAGRKLAGILLDVLPNGRPAKAFIMAAPSQGVANAAAKCALREMFVTALDANGDPVRGWTNRFRVVFTRK